MQPSGQPHPFSIVDHVIISLLDIASLPSVFYFNVMFLPQSNTDVSLLYNIDIYKDNHFYSREELAKHTGLFPGTRLNNSPNAAL